MRCRRSPGSAGPSRRRGSPARARPAQRQPLTRTAGMRTPLGLAKALALLVPGGVARRRLRLAIFGRPGALRDVLVAALRPYRGPRLRARRLARRATARSRPQLRLAGGARRSSPAARSASSMPASSSTIARASPSARRWSAARRRSARRDHGRAARPLRRGAMVLPRHLDGGLECDPFARFCVGDPMAEPETAPDPLAPAPAWRPGDARPDVRSMLRVDQAGEYGATRIYAGQLAVLGDRHPAARPDRPHGRAGEGASQAFRRAARRARRPADPAPAGLGGRRPRARRRHRLDRPRGRDGLHRRDRGRDRRPLFRAAGGAGRQRSGACRQASPASRPTSASIATPRSPPAPSNAPAIPCLYAAIRAGCRIAIELSKRI